jgi:excisionase family DNA binding protein
MAMREQDPKSVLLQDDGHQGRDRDGDPYALLTVDDVAALLKVSKSWVYEHTRVRGVPRAERLPHLKIGKYVRFEPHAVRAFIHRKCRVA